MQPGRELDAAVAEKVMGWQRIAGGLYPPGTANPDSEYGVVFSVCYEVPAYSTDIAAAWEVVNLARWHRIEFSPGLPGVVARLDFERDGIVTVGHGMAPTAPHAICLAALKAAPLNGGRR